MTQSQIAALLGRPLTASEVAGFDTILAAAIESLQALICSPIAPETAERVFNTRDGYKTAYVDLFSEVTSVTVGGTAISAEKYYKAFNGVRNGSVFNSIVLAVDPQGKDIVVNATWGFTTGDTNTIPADLQLVIAKLFAGVTKKDNGNVKSKKIEDFNITFMDETAYQRFYKDNFGVLNKYSVCDVINVRSGKIKCGC